MKRSCFIAFSLQKVFILFMSCLMAQACKTDPVVDWSARRSEILDMFQREVYGNYPAQPDTLLTEVMDQANTLGRMASRKQIRMWFTKDKSGPYVDWMVVTPRYCGAKVPAQCF